MLPLRIPAFAGMVPRTARHLLQDTQAQFATNARLTSGGLQPFHDTRLVHNPVIAGLLTVHRIVEDDGTEHWLGWNVDVDAVKGPIAGDTTHRVYYTGDNEPRVTNLALATAGAPLPFSFYVLGVFPPKTAASVSHAGGVGEAVSRAFLYTFVTQWGEESQPSPASAVTVGKVDGTWTIGGTTPMDIAPANTFAVTGSSWAGGVATLNVASTFGLRVGEEISVSGMNPAGFDTSSAIITALAAGSVSYALALNPGAFVAGGTITRIAPHNTTGMMKRIYWTETDASGVTTFRFVKEVTVATTNTTVAGNTVSAEALPSEDWAMPPVGMRGLCLHPGGAMVGFDKNELLFSEPNIPYAWPDKYRITLGFGIVGIGIFGTNILAATKGTPYVISGQHPESMSESKIDQPWPCLAKRGLASLGYGVVYPAPHGLVLVGVSGAELLTAGMYTQEEFKALKPETFVGAPYAGRYVASYDPGSGNRQLLIIDRAEFASVVAVNKNCQALYADPGTGTLYVIIADQIYEWDSLEASFIIYDWMSKEYVLPKPLNIGAAKVDADFTLTPGEIAAINAARAAVQASNQATLDSGNYNAGTAQSELGVLEIGGVDIEDLPASAADSLQFQLWINNKLKFTKTLTSAKAFKMPQGYKADRVAVRITGSVKVNGVVFGNTMESLSRT